jgi:hypothetical protein
MTARPTLAAGTVVGANHSTVACVALLLGVSALSGCSSGAALGAGAGTDPTPPTTTRTVTVTVTPTPPRATDQPIPTVPQTYAEEFVAAWVRRDRTRATQLGTADAVGSAFARSVTTAPSLAGCEGAMGSTYCTFKGSTFSMIVRVLNEMTRQGQPHAVIEARFGS